MERAGGVDLLLAGPRGRRACQWLTGVEVFEHQVAELDDQPGSVDAGPSEIRWVDALPVTPAVVRRTAAAVGAAWEARAGRALDEDEVLGAVADAAACAMYWQPPDDDDLVAAHPAVVAALRPVAETLVASETTDWWDRPVPLDDQHVVAWIRTPKGQRSRPPALTGSAARLRAWREVAVEKDGSLWWSFPRTVSTSASRGDFPATELVLVEDEIGDDRARVARVRPGDGVRVLEIVTTQDWVDLVDAFPLDVTGARRRTWDEVTGASGPWLLPDFAAVREAYDGVHLTVLAYLAGAGRALPCRGGSTVIAGWEPDVTWWLSDCLTQAEEPSTWVDVAGPGGHGPRWVEEPDRPRQAGRPRGRRQPSTR